MQQRDLLKDQFERLGRVLGAMLTKAINHDPLSTINNTIVVSNKDFISEFNIRIEDVITYIPEELCDFINKNQLTSEHCEVLGQYCEKIGGYQSSDLDKKQWLSVASSFVLQADHKSDVMSLERMNLLNRIYRELDNIA